MSVDYVGDSVEIDEEGRFYFSVLQNGPTHVAIASVVCDSQIRDSQIRGSAIRDER